MREVYQTVYAKLPELEKITITGLEEELNVRRFEDATIYPNPAQNYFKVSMSDDLTTDLDWVIYDQLGASLLNGTFTAGESIFEVDSKSLPVGLHLLAVTNGSDPFG